jgi:malto-oligosyltrehalose synthase/4-alpha-glucanotransferase
MYNPIATYRIQFHKEFTFKALSGIVDYLQKLGIGTLYASPVFSAMAGSTHGYDGIDPNRINPEIGTEDEFVKLAESFKAKNIGWLQDIVPNHMAFHPDNKWLADVLEKGRESAYASFFDIDWANGKLMVPFLGAKLDDAIEQGDLEIAIADKKPVLKYFDSTYPLAKESIEGVDIARANQDKAMLRQIIEQQHYRLCHWQETSGEINYRRFFTINGLLCLNIQDKKVFDAYHALIAKYVQGGIIQGLRVDHIDGLFDPWGYLNNLRDLAGDKTYTVVEKILEPGEELPADWPVQGTTGYDFLGIINNLFTNRDAEKKLTEFYQKFTGDRDPVEGQIHEKKAYILHNDMRGELDNLHLLFKNSQFVSREKLERAGEAGLKNAIGELLVRLPVYRLYPEELPLADADRLQLENIFKDISDQKPELEAAVQLLRDIFLNDSHHDMPELQDKALYFLQRCMQFSGPLMAKGVEDTLMYTYNRFIAHNDVGDAPESFGISVDRFHELMTARQKKWPMAMNATSTHDTKRGEDSRARLNVISDLPEEWLSAVKEWHRLNKKSTKDKSPDKNDEYFIYQSLLGALPMPGYEDDLQERLHQYMVKALREAKRHSGWARPDETYEAAVKEFVSGVLETDSKFYKSFVQFYTQVVDHGIVNALSQVVLKFCCPGVPDIYQGTELWDLSLVDPDNRRKVDFERRSEYLDQLHESALNFKDAWADRYSGKIKLQLTRQLLAERQKEPELYAKGLYLPLEVKGKYKECIVAFARIFQKKWHVVVAPLHTAQICREQKCEVPEINWKNTRIILPDHAPAQWLSMYSDADLNFKGEVLISEVFDGLPLGLLKSNLKNTGREAGVLMSVTSLPSAYGIGDLGPEAYKFADFLHRNLQSVWQLLPLNPISSGSGFSPYSSISAMAVNDLLISPELLVRANLLTHDELSGARLPPGKKADYTRAEELKCAFLETAYSRYLTGDYAALRIQFDRFCQTEAYWLDDYASFAAIKQHFKGQAWYEWPQEFRIKDEDAISSFCKAHDDAIKKIKWFQFIFSLQWAELRAYCAPRGIKLLGDVPFYVSYDSADVWANRGLFCLDSESRMTGIAGVPPDYFSEDGQLWGMPTFNWQQMKKTNYDWWRRRLKRNLELFDEVRLDHFRAFAEYWEVPAGEKTARNGKWLPGPGAEFFEIIKKEFGKLPFVAEDLGDNMEPVYALRDETGLPGMKVLQFAFGENMPESVDIPHNYSRNCIVYTGTHDNNTTIGWYHQESSKADHKRLEQYVGSNVRLKNVHHVLARMAYSSVAKTVIIPMQDLLGLDAEDRMNTPGSGENNWLWRLTDGQLKPETGKLLRSWVKFYNRY